MVLSGAKLLRSSRHDRGSVLVLTLVLTVIMAIVVVAIARYAATGLRSSEVTTERTASNTIASAERVLGDRAVHNEEPPTASRLLAG